MDQLREKQRAGGEEKDASGPPGELIVGIVDTVGTEEGVAGSLEEGNRGSNAVGPVTEGF